MADPIAIANAVAKSFGGSPQASAASPSATPSPSGNGTSDEAMKNFHNDLDQSICPDCHTTVKNVMNPSPQGSVSESTKPVPAMGGSTSVPDSPPSADDAKLMASIKKTKDAYRKSLQNQ